MSLSHEALYTLRLHDHSHLITECESSWWVMDSYKPNYSDIKIKTRLSTFKWLENGPLTALFEYIRKQDRVKTIKALRQKRKNN